MVRHYKRKGNHHQWSHDSLVDAIKKVENEELSLRLAATAYGIPKATLLRRVNEAREKNKIPEPKKLGRCR